MHDFVSSEIHHHDFLRTQSNRCLVGRDGGTVNEMVVRITPCLDDFSLREIPYFDGRFQAGDIELRGLRIKSEPLNLSLGIFGDDNVPRLGVQDGISCASNYAQVFSVLRIDEGSPIPQAKVVFQLDHLRSEVFATLNGIQLNGASWRASGKFLSAR